MVKTLSRSVKPSRFSRMSPTPRIRVLFSNRWPSSGVVSATKRGSSAGRVAMKVGSIVKLLRAGWQLPHVRPLPLKVSSKNRRRPSMISSVPGIGLGGGSRHAAASSNAKTIDRFLEDHIGRSFSGLRQATERPPIEDDGDLSERHSVEWCLARERSRPSSLRRAVP